VGIELVDLLVGGAAVFAGSKDQSECESESEDRCGCEELGGRVGEATQGALLGDELVFHQFQQLPDNIIK
jgi:hypothetical protein